MSLWQAFQGAQVELAAIPSPLQKLKRIGQISRLFVSEIIGTVALAPYARRALSIYRSTPAPEAFCANDVHQVYVAKEVRYGDAPRNSMDIWLPSEAAAVLQQTSSSSLHADRQGQQLPVVIFVHGGVWAAGEKWHYAPLAACLARLGVVACVVQYTLYPEARVPQLVQEVSAAFDWAMENIGNYGGDSQQVSLLGHSAGAQLCMMALLNRAQAAHEKLQSTSGDSSSTCSSTMQQHNKQQLQPGGRPVMPQQFVGVTGVYDIAKHYAYEKERGVHELSTMKRAMGGFPGFAAMSPAVILGAALQRQRLHSQEQQQEQQQQQRSVHSKQTQGQQQQQEPQDLLQPTDPAACAFYSSFQLSGEAVAHRIGFDRSSSHHEAADANLQVQSEIGMEDLMHFDMAAAGFLPATVLMSSCTDLTVPWYESAEMYWRLLDCGVPAKHLVYNKVGHGDFVVDWPGDAQLSPYSDVDDWRMMQAAAISGGHHAEGAVWRGEGGHDGTSSSSSHDFRSRQQQQRQQLLAQLPNYCRDIAMLVTGQCQANFVHHHQHLQQHRGGDTQVVQGLSYYRRQATADQVMNAVDAAVLVQPAELN